MDRKLLTAAALIAAALIAAAILLYKPAQPAKPSQPAQPQQPTKPWTPDGKVEPGEYANHLDLGKLEIYWRTDNQYLYMALKAPTKGWLAIGFNPTTAMKDADMIIAWVDDKDHTTHVVDAYSTGTYGPHPPDTKLGGTDDILQYAGTQGQYTIIEFKRKLDTGDKYDATLHPGDTVKIIWAISSTDQFTHKHDIARGTAQIKL